VRTATCDNGVGIPTGRDAGRYQTYGDCHPGFRGTNARNDSPGRVHPSWPCSFMVPGTHGRKGRPPVAPTAAWMATTRPLPFAAYHLMTSASAVGLPPAIIIPRSARYDPTKGRKPAGWNPALNAGLPHVGTPVYPTASNNKSSCRKAPGNPASCKKRVPRDSLCCFRKAGSPASSILFLASGGFPVAFSAPFPRQSLSIPQRKNVLYL
jgi:hypothetical protein